MPTALTGLSLQTASPAAEEALCLRRFFFPAVSLDFVEVEDLEDRKDFLDDEGFLDKLGSPPFFSSAIVLRATSPSIRQLREFSVREGMLERERTRRGDSKALLLLL
ncbi:hypothetical protein MTO96_032090 [Rhipicephalus appendiculatus]